MLEMLPQVSEPACLRNFRAMIVVLEPEEFAWHFTPEARQTARVIAKYFPVIVSSGRGHNGHQKQSVRPVVNGNRISCKSQLGQAHLKY